MHLSRIYGGGGSLALAVALSLVSFTSAAVAQSLVTGRQVKDGSVRSVDLRTDQGVRGADVRDGSLSAEQLSSLPPGPPGNQGAQGLPGLAGLDNFDYEISQPFTVDPKSDAEMQVACTGIPIGGGTSADSYSVQTMDSHPLLDGTGWAVHVYNSSGTATNAYAWAVCASL